MAEFPVTVDPHRLRAVANRVERSAHALNKFRLPELRHADLPGSATADVVGSAKLADYFDLVVGVMMDWAEIARASADAFAAADEANTARLAES